MYFLDSRENEHLCRRQEHMLTVYYSLSN